MVELVKYIVNTFVDDKEAVVVALDGDTIKISVSQKDMGKIIGRQGKIAKAIRTVVKAGGLKAGKKYIVDILESDEILSKENDAVKDGSTAEDAEE